MQKTQPAFARAIAGAFAFSPILWITTPAVSAVPPPAPAQYSQAVHTVLPGADEQTVTRNGVLVAIDHAPIPAHRDSLGDWPEQPAQRTVLNLATHRTITRILPHGLPDCAHPGTKGGDIGDSFGDPFIMRLMAAPVSDLGKAAVNGMPAEKFQAQLDGQTYTIWREPSWGLVLKVTSAQPFFGAPAEPDGQTTYYEVKRFTVGAVDPALFALPESCRKAIAKP